MYPNFDFDFFGGFLGFVPIKKRIIVFSISQHIHIRQQLLTDNLLYQLQYQIYVTLIQ